MIEERARERAKTGQLSSKDGLGGEDKVKRRGKEKVEDR